MNHEKLVGYSLLLVGIVTIIFAAFSAYTVFTKQTKPVQLFNLPAPKLDVAQMMSGSLPPELRGMIDSSQNTQEIISQETINQPLNLYAHLFLMGFVANIGHKIASLGVMLIRPVIVKMKETKV